MKVLRIIMQPYGGDQISDCVLEALEKSLEEGVDVEFAHNDKLYRASFEKILDACAEVKKP